MALAQTVAKLEARGGKTAQLDDLTIVTVAKDELVTAITEAKRQGFEMLSDVFGTDYLTYPGHQGKRFRVTYNLYSVAHNERLFVRVGVDDGEALPTITGLWKGASFMEREVYDMLGLEFEGHPDLRKLITPEDLDGHPHRRDFPVGETPTLFNDGRFIDPASFRAGMSGQVSGLTGWRGGARKGVSSQSLGGVKLKTDPELHNTTGEGGQ
jgi:NADH-quinone oxidoreductase subunit C